MAAYVIARVNVIEPDRYENYKALAPAAIEKYGGEYLARGGKLVNLEGEVENRRVVVLRFPSVEAVETFYSSPEYQAAKKEREGAATCQLIVVEGV